MLLTKTKAKGAIPRPVCAPLGPLIAQLQWFCSIPCTSMCTLYYHNLYTYTYMQWINTICTYLYISKPFMQLNVCTYSLSICGHSQLCWVFTQVHTICNAHACSTTATGLFFAMCKLQHCMASFLLKPSNCVGAWICVGRLDSLTIYYFHILYVVAIAESLWLFTQVHTICKHMHAWLLLLVSSLPCVNFSTAWLLSCSSPLTV